MILLTGSSGFIGTNIIKYFVKKKIKFHAVDLKKNNYLQIKNFTRLDLSNKNKELYIPRDEPLEDNIYSEEDIIKLLYPVWSDSGIGNKPNLSDKLLMDIFFASCFKLNTDGSNEITEPGCDLA